MRACGHWGLRLRSGGGAGGSRFGACRPRNRRSRACRAGDFAADPAGFLAGRTRHGLVALAEAADVDVFRQVAEAEGRWPVLYKATPRMAVRARSAGLTVLQIAREAGFRRRLHAGSARAGGAASQAASRGSGRRFGRAGGTARLGSAGAGECRLGHPAGRGAWVFHGPLRSELLCAPDVVVARRDGDVADLPRSTRRKSGARWSGRWTSCAPIRRHRTGRRRA